MPVTQLKYAFIMFNISHFEHTLAFGLLRASLTSKRSPLKKPIEGLKKVEILVFIALK